LGEAGLRTEADFIVNFSEIHSKFTAYDGFFFSLGMLCAIIKQIVYKCMEENQMDFFGKFSYTGGTDTWDFLRISDGILLRR
jgi:hypothetical protein